MPPFLDQFDRVDNAGSLGAPWTVHAGQFGVLGSDGRYTGDLYYPGKAGYSARPAVAATVDVGSADMIIEWDSGPATAGHERLFRFAAVDSTLLVGESRDRTVLVLVAVTPSSSTVLGTTHVSGWQTTRVRVIAEGTSIKVWTDDVLRISATSSVNVTATRAGIGGSAIGWQPTGAFTDTFTRANSSTLGSPWTEHRGVWGILSNRARNASGSGTLSATVELGSPIQVCEWDWSALSKGAAQQAFRFKDNNNFWFVSGNGTIPGNVYLFRRGGGFESIAATATGVTWGVGSTLRVSAEDTRIRVWSGSTLIINHATTDVGEGTRAGLSGYNGGGNEILSTRWSRFAGEGFQSNAPVASVDGPWLDGLHWTRFYASRWGPLGGIYVDGAVHF